MNQNQTESKPQDVEEPTDEGLDETTGSSSFDRWPLNVNPEMDRHAASHGLSHWSCVSTKSNEWWIRKDGHQFEAFATGKVVGGYPEELRAFDIGYPMNA